MSFCVCAPVSNSVMLCRFKTTVKTVQHSARSTVALNNIFWPDLPVLNQHEDDRR